MSIEKIRDPRDIKHRFGDMEADYIYTLDVAGGEILQRNQRNAINLGLPAIECKNITKRLKMGTNLKFTLTTD